jgi:hypothetical protein
MLTPRFRHVPLATLLALPLLMALGSGPEESPAQPETLAALVAAGQGPETAATCGMCHAAIYEEWKGAKHAVAWTDEIYQEQMKDRRRPQLCHGCHIPGRVLDRLGNRPRARDRHLEEGVTCVACHQKGDAQHGPYGSDTIAHFVEKDPAFSFEGSVSLCASCHSTKIADILPVAKDFIDADMASKGKSCIGCHMPEVERHAANRMNMGADEPVGEVRMGRRHSLLGPGDVEFAASAFSLSATKRGSDLILSIRDEAGHRIPGLALRTFPFRIRQLDGDGNELQANEVVISAENGLMAEETREFPFPLADGAVAIEVQADHILMGEKVATILTRRLEL